MHDIKSSLPLFLCDLDRYGRIGHQTSRMLTAFLLAHFTDGHFIPLEYKFFPYRANQILDFSKSERAVNQNIYINNSFNLSKGYREPHGNDCFDLSSMGELKFIARLISSKSITNIDGFTLFHLAFDQPPGLLLKLLQNPIIFNDFQRVFIGSKQLQSFANFPRYDLVIHIRRGDVTKSSYPDWWIDDDLYLEMINDVIHNTHVSVKICVCTQSGISERFNHNLQNLNKKYPSKFSIRKTKEAWSNEDEIQDFLVMANSKILIGGQSSFPCLAALSAQNNYVYLGHKKPAEYPFGLKPNSSFFLAEYKTTKSAATSIANQIITKLNTSI